MSESFEAKWTLGKPVGRGGQGSVYRCTPKSGDFNSDQDYVVKRLKNIDSEQARQRFNREINATKRLDDNRIVKIVDFGLGLENEPPYYVMPYYQDYTDLGKLQASKQSPYKNKPLETLVLIKQIAEAITHAHTNGVIHRDLKPNNILVRDRSQIVVLDFGCCLMTDDHGTITLVDEGVGARNYLAPECESGYATEVDHRADYYSLGKIAWTLLTGRQPYARERPGFRELRISNVLPSDPMCWHVEELIRHTVRNEPINRIEHAQSLIDGVDGLIQNIQEQVMPPHWAALRCALCGSKSIKESSGSISDPFKVDLFIFLGNKNNNPDATAVFCTKCGHIGLRDKRPLAKHLDEYENLE